METKDKIKAILGFLAVVIVAFALFCTCLGAFNYAYVNHEGFYAVCGAITLIAGGYAVFKASKKSMEPFMHDWAKKN